MSERYCKDCRYCHHANIGLLCMGQKGMPHTRPYGSCDSWKSAKQTNADRIRSMTDEELDKFLGDVQWDVANYCGGVTQKQEYPVPEQRGAWLDWLKEVVDE